MPVKTIAPSEFRLLLDAGRPVTLIDVRTPAEHARVHARGARLMPLDALDAAAVAAARQSADGPVYVICQSGARAAKACEKLAAAGLADVVSIEGGTAAWEQAGLPVERGQTRVISLERQVRIAAGLLIVIGTLLTWLVHPIFLAIPAFVGTGLILAGVTDSCAMGMMLSKMKWNR